MNGIAISDETRRELIEEVLRPNYSFIWHFNRPTKVKWPRGYVEQGVKELTQRGAFDAWEKGRGE